MILALDASPGNEATPLLVVRFFFLQVEIMSEALEMRSYLYVNCTASRSHDLGTGCPGNEATLCMNCMVTFTNGIGIT